jgi:hypothetical protein
MPYTAVSTDSVTSFNRRICNAMVAPQRSSLVWRRRLERGTVGKEDIVPDTAMSADNVASYNERMGDWMTIFILESCMAG